MSTKTDLVISPLIKSVVLDVHFSKQRTSLQFVIPAKSGAFRRKLTGCFATRKSPLSLRGSLRSFGTGALTCGFASVAQREPRGQRLAGDFRNAEVPSIFAGEFAGLRRQRPYLRVASVAHAWVFEGRLAGDFHASEAPFIFAGEFAGLWHWRFYLRLCACGSVRASRAETCGGLPRLGSPLYICGGVCGALARALLPAGLRL